MFKINPYRPGAGLMPTYLAGRDDDIADVSQLFRALSMNIPTQSIIFTGFRGVGKTVLINRLQKDAEAMCIFCKHIEVESRNDFISQIAAYAQSFLRDITQKAKIEYLISKTLNAVKSLVISFGPSSTTFSLSLQEKELYKSGNLTQTLTDVFTAMGEAALEANSPICFFIDEIQYMQSNELNSLIAALHRTNQLGYPVMIIGAGLPKIYKMLSDEKTYSERLFIYKEIGSLTREQSRQAIIEPVKSLGVLYSGDAIEEIINTTNGYPFFYPAVM